MTTNKGRMFWSTHDSKSFSVRRADTEWIPKRGSVVRPFQNPNQIQSKKNLDPIKGVTALNHLKTWKRKHARCCKARESAMESFWNYVAQSQWRWWWTQRRQMMGLCTKGKQFDDGWNPIRPRPWCVAAFQRYSRPSKKSRRSSIRM